jgi:PAS domain S-box-containing protein
MIVSFIGLVILTAAAAGLPAIWLIRGQLERQAWAQVEQGSRAAQALYTARQNEMASLATLTAQRPTLRNLLLQGERAPLLAYLGPLQASAALDLILICDSQNRLVVRVGETVSDVPCTNQTTSGFEVLSAGGTSEIWLVATQSIQGSGDDWQGSVTVGRKLDDEFVTQMRAQTGLEHSLLLDDRPVATTLKVGSSTFQQARLEAVGGSMLGTFNWDEHPYYATWLSLDALPESRQQGVDLKAEIALGVADIAVAQRNLAWSLAGSILVVAAVGSLLGTFLARRIGQPLTHLAEAATALSKGDLDSSLAVEARVREVASVAQALERAREDLQRSLTELRQERDWTAHLLEAIVEGIVTLDGSGRITFFSQGAERVTGWNREEVLNRVCDDVFRPLETSKAFSQIIPPPGQRRKLSLQVADGRQVIFSITGARLAPPATRDARVALVFRDVSEEEAVHRIMGHFLANIAHEFRTPLSALAASAELLLDQASDLTPAELQDLLTSLHLGIVGLQTLVDNLLESASIEAGRFRVSPHPTNLGQIIAEAVRTMQPLLDKHGQHLMVELPVAIPVVCADSRRVVQVLVNLLSNASKYGPDEAEITIGASVRGGWVRVAVSDRGPGVPPEQRSDLFRRFVYPDKNNHKAQYGVGLGLSVVKAVIEAHEGQVGVEDRPGGGSVFWFTLPVEGDS